MYDFMEYCLRRYYRSSGWNEENQYSNLCSWSRTLLDFYTPRGLSLHLAKLPTPQFKPSYTMNALPSLNGSIGYLFTSEPLDVGTSGTVDFQDMVDQFCLQRTNISSLDSIRDKSYLVYGRMFFPGAALESMYVRRLSPRLQYLITAVNHPRDTGLPQMAFQLQYDVGKWCSECSYTTDDGLLGLRALYNFGKPSEEGHGQWSLGTEVYYGTLDKSGGLSTGLRYRTHPSSTSPINVTYTLNPIVGHMTTAYVAQVAENLVMCSRFEFSIYSYESDLALGFEYRTKNNNHDKEDKEKNLIVDETTTTVATSTKKLEGLIKVRLGFSSGLALMWEGRYKNTLFSLGLTADLSNQSNPIRTMGMEVQFFS
ncbi:mitochondrial distribution and morphology protein 10 [Halteromyces radiatus]|uniref:mitochondrial distribution and morphology protein 10 n=1 Tax=Halteromyces radiatus TaxID=101107 RepID=UPI00221EC59A|nr:mitochondrial distribution and morphology protein 10 [Halteromyces radiatus]KAI8078754.1 mitochondrial distribution and morphology protein 10 [Halteromyces radiatus]